MSGDNKKIFNQNMEILKTSWSQKVYLEAMYGTDIFKLEITDNNTANNSKYGIYSLYAVIGCLHGKLLQHNISVYFEHEDNVNIGIGSFRVCDCLVIDCSTIFREEDSLEFIVTLKENLTLRIFFPHYNRIGL